RIGLMGAGTDFYSTDETGLNLSNSTEYTVIAKPATGIQFRWTENTTTAINNIAVASDGINVYPNPVADYVFVDINSKEVKSIEVYNEIGNIVYANAAASKKTPNKIDMRSLPAGVYFIKINGDAAPIRKRIIKSQ
ncbi:MAG TPA: T9SS type A sorting domain-containing protein, partial [Bacteroidia bacterium]|nr:T9SS type A sorting domain-containing protein [Bacteroidia bacterium]